MLKYVAGFFGASPSDYYQGSQWQQQYGNQVKYNPTQYNAFNPGNYAGGLGNAYAGAANQQLSGQLSPAVQQQLNNQFQQNLQATRTGAYGMPAGAQAYNEQQAASQNALQGAVLGEQQIAQGESAALPYLGMGQQENQFAANLGEQQNQFGANLGEQQAQYAGNLTANAYQQAANNPGIFGNLLGAGTQFGLSQLFPTGQQSKNAYNPSNFEFGGYMPQGMDQQNQGLGPVNPNWQYNLQNPTNAYSYGG